MEASSNMKPVLIIAQHSELSKILNPLINIDKDEFYFEKLNYHELPASQKAAVSWIFYLFCDCAPAEEYRYEDPIENFQYMDQELQVLVLKAIAVRYGFLDLEAKRIEGINPIPQVVGMLFQKSEIAQIFKNYLSMDESSIDWENMRYSGLPGGFKVAISWSYSIFNRSLPREELGFRDPINDFGVMDQDLCKTILKAFALSYGWEITLSERPKSSFMKMLESMEKKMGKEDE